MDNALRRINRYGLLLCIAALIIGGMVGISHAENLMALDVALKKIFKEADHFKPETFTLTGDQIKSVETKADIRFGSSHLKTIQMYKARKEEQTLGFAYEDMVVGKWGPIHYLLGLDAEGAVRDIVILDYQEIRGRPIAKKRFLRQYKGKNTDNPVKLRRDIDGVTGATISSRSLTDGVRKLLYVFQETR